MDNKYSLRTMALLLCAFCNFCLSAQKSDTSLSGFKTLYFDSPVLLNCKVRLPVSFIQEDAYPLIIGLHGGGGSYETFSEFLIKFNNPGFIIAVPEAPYKWLMNGEIGYDWAGWPSGDLAFMQAAMILTSKYIENLILALGRKYKLKDIYLLGFSQGSIITQVAGISNHNLLKGLIILSGPEPYYPDKPEIMWPGESEMKKANELKIFIAHGTSDQMVDFTTAVNSVARYEDYGFEVTFIEFDGGHEIAPRLIEEINRWLTLQ